MTNSATTNATERGCRVTGQSAALIKTWVLMKRSVEMAERELLRHRLELESDENRLAKWLLPDDCRCGETIGIWYGDSLLTAKKESVGGIHGGEKYTVTVRQRGRSITEIF